jgi:NAD(P) transhydrogenase subunit alpha
MKKKLAVLKEQEGLPLVALTPKNVEQLAAFYDVVVETGAGFASGYADEQYVKSGAEIVGSRSVAIEACEVILSYDSQLRDHVPGNHKTFVGFFNVKNQPNVLQEYIGKPTSVYSLDLIVRSSLAQSMDVLSSVAAISGYQAVLTAAEISPHVLPMFTTAGGTLRPASVLILGAGVAGLQAIATAKRLGARVKAFDVRKATKTEVESLGAAFIEIEGALDVQQAGGYAVEQSSAYMKKVAERLALEAIAADVVITTAKVPGKKAPILVTADTVAQMKPGSVIVDLAAETGGNCALTKQEEIVEAHGLRIVGYSSFHARCAASTSYLVANNFTSFLAHYAKYAEEEAVDNILQSTKVIAHGKVMHSEFIEEIITL